MEADSFSLFEVTIIRQNLVRKTDADIADLLQRPIELVSAKIDELTGGGAIRQSKSQAQEQKAAEKNSKAAEKKQAIRLKQLNGELATRQYKKKNEPVFIQKKKEEKVFATKSTDYSQKRLIRVDSKTFIYVSVDEDTEEAIARHKAIMERAKKVAEEKESGPRIKKKSTKVCIRCCQRKELDDFPKNKKSEDGKDEMCDKCHDMVKRIREHEVKFEQ